jgi:hypothetical protein
MPALVVLLATTLLVSSVSAPQQPPGQPALPRKSGVFAMTSQGAVELRISGEADTVDNTQANLGLGQQSANRSATNMVKCYFSAKDIERIPVVESLQSFYVNMIGWSPRDLFMVVGREALINQTEKYQRFVGRAVNRGIAFVVSAADLESPAALLQSIKKLAPAGVPVDQLEVYVVLAVRNSEGLTPRAYPVRIAVPKG